MKRVKTLFSQLTSFLEESRLLARIALLTKDKPLTLALECDDHAIDIGDKRFHLNGTVALSLEREVYD